VTVRVPIVRPDLGEEEIAAAARVLRSGWILQGPEVEAFEREFAAAVGASHAVAVSSGTAALELALRVAGVGPGDEVVTVSHSFIATANCAVTVGARPVFVDVEPVSFGMDPRHLAAAIGPRTRAVLPVHQLGLPCDLPAILEAAGGLPVIEDAACALGSELGGARVGRPGGLLACFSFHPRKVMTTGDGGMITTADGALARRLRRLRAHGLEGDRFVEPASNHRMTDLQAAVARPQLARLDRSLAERRRIVGRYHAALHAHPRLAPAETPPGTRPNWQSYPARARDGDAAPILARLVELGIGVRPGIANAHEQPAYAGSDRARIGPLGLAISERLRADTVMLPIFQGMTPDEEEAVLAGLAAV
jgi:dTDP-4-amino-4,6-dideoxygalactose transaminase